MLIDIIQLKNLTKLFIESNISGKYCSLATIMITRITEYFIYHLENMILKRDRERERERERAQWVKVISGNNIP